MLTEYLEHASILVCQMLLDTITYSNATTAKTQLSTHFCIDTDIQLSYVNMLYDFLIQCNSIIHFFLSRTINIVMTLHTDTIDGHTSLFHSLYHVIDTLALYWITFIVVIIEQQCFRISLTSILECLSDEFITSNLIEL